MQVVLDPLSRKLASAPPEDEAISLNEAQAVEEAKQGASTMSPFARGRAA